jgi:hypothetical protein
LVQTSSFEEHFKEQQVWKHLEDLRKVWQTLDMPVESVELSLGIFSALFEISFGTTCFFCGCQLLRHFQRFVSLLFIIILISRARRTENFSQFSTRCCAPSGRLVRTYCQVVTA